jgi:diguanylate cyclase (GGDEF)-like protein/PAS domain S-box-containing protein
MNKVCKIFVEQNALRITAIYMIVGILLFLFSDSLLVMIVDDFQRVSLAILRDWLFIGLTGCMIYGLIFHSQRKFKQKNRLLLMLTEKQLVAQKQLSQQFNEIFTRDEKIERQNLVLTSLHETLLGLMNRLDLAELLKTIVLSATQLIGTAHGQICLIEKDKEIYIRTVGIGIYAEIMGTSDNLAEGLTGKVYQTGERIVIDDYSHWEHRLHGPFFNQIRCAIAIPLKSQSTVVGIIGLSFVEPKRRLVQHEIDLLTRFAELASIALDNAKLFTTYRNELFERRQAEAALSASEANYRAIFDAANDGIFVHDAATGRLIDINKKAYELYGSSYAEVMENGLSGLGTGESPYSKKEARKWIHRAADQSQLFEWVIKNKAKEHVWVEVNLKRAIIGHRNCILAVVRNIEERKAKEIELHKMQSNNQALMNAIPDILFRIKRNGTFIDYKAGNEKVYLPPDQFLGKNVAAILPPDLAEKVMISIEKAIISGQLQLFEYEMFIDNQRQSYEARIVPSVADEIVAIIRNVTERKEMEERLTYLSLHDSMTGLYNRAYFEEEMQRIENTRGLAVGIIVCDIDGLKLINDNLGHSIGDDVIRTAADVLRRSFRHGDLVARIGGDEFAVIIHSNLNYLFEEACQRIEMITGEYNASCPTALLSLSTGFAISEKVPIDMHALFIEADNQMYQGKIQRHKSTRRSIAQGMMDSLEARNIIIEGHTKRLQAMIFGLANALGLPDQSKPNLQLLARFYDIGKVGIPDSILLKPGKLSTEEFEMMKRHCEIGNRIAANVPDLEPIANWILEHHEWCNGKGYPLGTKSEDIPIECRILAIADAYDAMTSDRPYRDVLRKENAIVELRKCAGTQFDSNLVEIFINYISTK